jgi:hypothetical protein
MSHVPRDVLVGSNCPAARYCITAQSYQQGAWVCRHSTHTPLCNTSPCAPYLKLSASCLPSHMVPILTSRRKHWHQLDDFHSLTDLKIHVSAHKEPQITAGLRSVCWKVQSNLPLFPSTANAITRSSSSSRRLTARHGLPTSAMRARHTSLCDCTISAPYITQTNSSLPWTH